MSRKELKMVRWVKPLWTAFQEESYTGKKIYILVGLIILLAVITLIIKWV